MSSRYYTQDQLDANISITTLEDAIRKSSVYDVNEYLHQKDIIDERFLSMANTKESQQIILDYIANDRKNIKLDEIARSNAPAHVDDRVSHGLYAYGDGIWGVNDNSGLTETEVVSKNLETIISKPELELAMSEDVYRLGPIGVTGKADITGYFPRDLSSKSNSDGTRTSALRGSRIIDGIMDEGFGSTYGEYYGKNFQIDSLWVKDAYFQEHHDEVISLMQKHKIDTLELVHDNHSFSPEYTPKSTDIERIDLSDLDKIKKVSEIDLKKPQTYQEAINEVWEKRSSIAKTAFVGGFRGEKHAQYERLRNIEKPDLLFHYSDLSIHAEISKPAKMRDTAKLNVFTVGDMLFINAHGSKKGKIAFSGDYYTPRQIASYLQVTKKIPDNIKEIYTLNCYGGVQEESAAVISEIPIRSGHTSASPIFQTNFQGYDVNGKFEPGYVAYALADGDISEHLKQGVIRNSGEELKMLVTNDEFGEIVVSAKEAIKKRVIEIKQERKRFRESFVTGKDGQVYIKNAKPNPKSVQPEVPKNIIDTPEITPSFLDENGNIKPEYTKKRKKYNVQRGPKVVKPEKDINELYRQYIDKKFIETASDIWKNRAGEELVEQVRKNTDLFFDITGSPGIYGSFADLDFYVENGFSQAHMFRQGDLLFINAHGTLDGKLGFGDEVISVGEFIQRMKDNNLIPDDVKKIYTITCHGGALESFTTDDGIVVQSSHSSLENIYSMENGTNGVSFQLDGHGEISEELKEDLLRNQNEKVESVIDSIAMENIIDKYQPGYKDRVNKFLNGESEGESEIDTKGESVPPEKPNKPDHHNDWENSNKDRNTKGRNTDSIKNEEFLEHTRKAGKKFKTKNLSSASAKAIDTGGSVKVKGGKGILAAAALIAGGIVLHSLADDDKPKKKKEKKYNHYQSNAYQEQFVGQEQQIAADISSYRYGKKMTGFNI